MSAYRAHREEIGIPVFRVSRGDSWEAARLEGMLADIGQSLAHSGLERFALTD